MIGILVVFVVGFVFALAVLGQSVAGGGVAHVASAPTGLFSNLTSLDHKLDALIREEKKSKGLEFHELKRRINEIKDEKRRVVSTYFNQDTYGIKAHDVILSVDCIDSELFLAYGIAFEANEHYLPSKLRDYIDKFFEAAKKCKQRLETELHAAEGPTTTLTTTVGTPTVRGSGP